MNRQNSTSRILKVCGLACDLTCDGLAGIDELRVTTEYVLRKALGYLVWVKALRPIAPEAVCRMPASQALIVDWADLAD